MCLYTGYQMDSFSNPADFLMDITNGEAVSALVTPSAGTKNRTGSGGSSEYKNIKMVQMFTFLHLSITHASSRPCCHHGLCLTNCNAMQIVISYCAMFPQQNVKTLWHSDTNSPKRIGTCFKSWNTKARWR